MTAPARTRVRKPAPHCQRDWAGGLHCGRQPAHRCLVAIPGALVEVDLCGNCYAQAVIITAHRLARS